MKPIRKIDDPGNRRYPLDLHLDYQQRLYQVISRTEPQKIFLEEADIAEWLTNIKLESDVACEVRAAKESEALHEKDEERNYLVTTLFQEIRQAARSPIAARREAGHLLKITIAAYKGLQRNRWSGKTAHISALLADLSTTEAAEAMELLGTTAIANLLRRANGEFNDLREARSTLAAGIDLPTSQHVRGANDRMADAIFHHIEVAYTMAATDSDRQDIGDLIDQINQRTREAKATYKQSEALRKQKLRKKKELEAAAQPEPTNRKKSAARKRKSAAPKTETVAPAAPSLPSDSAPAATASASPSSESLITTAEHPVPPSESLITAAEHSAPQLESPIIATERSEPPQDTPPPAPAEQT